MILKDLFTYTGPRKINTEIFKDFIQVSENFIFVKWISCFSHGRPLWESCDLESKLLSQKAFDQEKIAMKVDFTFFFIERAKKIASEYEEVKSGIPIPVPRCERRIVRHGRSEKDGDG